MKTDSRSPLKSADERMNSSLHLETLIRKQAGEINDLTQKVRHHIATSCLRAVKNSRDFVSIILQVSSMERKHEKEILVLNSEHSDHEAKLTSEIDLLTLRLTDERGKTQSNLEEVRKQKAVSVPLTFLCWSLIHV